MNLDEIRILCSSQGYPEAAFQATIEYRKRRDRNINPPGRFDSAGRFYADEQTEHIQSVRSPSRRFPYSQMTAARSAQHVAELHGVVALHIKRIAKVIDATEQGETLATLLKILKKAA